jgi:S-methylmethionine-dependent homocysteine/selenocysteine methylase
MDLNFFKQTRILDGGMGQELLARGMKSNGTLWSANALLNEDYHQLLLDIHKDFIKAGSEVIITNTFTTRRIRLAENNIEEKFDYLVNKAGEIASNVKKIYPHIFIGGSLPPQLLTYQADTRDEKNILSNFVEMVEILYPYVDFYYFDVLSSVREFDIALKAVKKFNKPYLFGLHISEGTALPSGEKISDFKKFTKDPNLMGIMLSCVSPENYKLNASELKKLNVPYGFKFNAFQTTAPKGGYTAGYKKNKGNPNEFLGKRDDLNPMKLGEFAKEFKNMGATILGGCCETRPAHIEQLAKLK